MKATPQVTCCRAVHTCKPGPELSGSNLCTVKSEVLSREPGCLYTNSSSLNTTAVPTAAPTRVCAVPVAGLLVEPKAA